MLARKGRFAWNGGILLVAVISLVFVIGSSWGLILPPTDKLRMGMGEMLLEECETEAEESCCQFHWEEDVEEDYQLASSVFTKLAFCDRENLNGNMKLWFPRCRNRQGEIDRISNAINANSHRLGGVLSSFQHWPDAPASVLHFTWSDGEVDGDKGYKKEGEEEVAAAITATEDYVENRLVRLGMCPYTRSMTSAAIGLKAFGVNEGPVVIRHAAHISDSSSTSTTPNAKFTSPAAAMAALFWQGVTELFERPEEEVATLLLLAPSVYDDNFEAFYKTCDDLIEQSVQMSSKTVGRVWFHPQYELSKVGYSTGGHTLPIDVVSGYMDEYLAEHTSLTRPNDDDFQRGHDGTRWTPHATINLLRASQLKKAKDNENRAKIYARNILQILDDEKNNKA